MNSRLRFRETMRYGEVDRVPYFEEEIRQEVIHLWHRQGLPPDADLGRMFRGERLEELETDLEPHPQSATWPASRAGLRAFQRRLDPQDPSRLPIDWKKKVNLWHARGHVLMLYVHDGLFLSLGVRGWHRFAEIMDLINDDPGFIQELMKIQGEFAAGVAKRVLREVEIDAAVFSEPIGGNHGPLISPRMYEAFVLRNYEPLLAVLREYRVETIVFKTFANARLLLPGILKWGFNCLWACEVNTGAMDYRSLREEFGRDLRLIGGIDLDALRCGKEAIRREILEKVPPILSDGGYIPLADGRIREDVPFENYVYYRRLLEEVTETHQYRKGD